MVPDLIEDDDRGIAHVRGNGEVSADQLDAVYRARKLCPEQAVTLVADRAQRSTDD